MDSGKDVRQDEFADFTIRLKDGREIKCHKIILARVSPVFLRILRHDNVETRTNTMTLDAFEPETVEAFLDFIYLPQGSRSLEETRLTLDLLKMSHMYDVKYLLDKCTENLIKTIEDDNAVQLWSVAELLSIDELKEAVLEYLAQKGEEMLEVPGFKETCESPEMKTSLTTFMAKNLWTATALAGPATSSESESSDLFIQLLVTLYQRYQNHKIQKRDLVKQISI